MENSNKKLPSPFHSRKKKWHLRKLFLFKNRFLCDNQSFQKLDERIQRSLFIFACVNSVMNPIVYGFFNLRKKTARRSQQVKQIWNHLFQQKHVYISRTCMIFISILATLRWLFVLVWSFWFPTRKAIHQILC